MTLNSNDYIIQKPYIKSWLEAKASQPGFSLVEEIGPLSLATNTHICVVTHFIIQLCGSSPDLEEKKKKLMDFYNIKSII